MTNHKVLPYRYSIQRVKYANRAIPRPRAWSTRYVPPHTHIRGTIRRRAQRREDRTGTQEEWAKCTFGFPLQCHGLPCCSSHAHTGIEGVLSSG